MLGFASLIVILSIILAGVLNTVRMNIRERIREIGTVRAVGMQKKLVIRTLVVEVGLLAVLSSLLGILASSGLMDLASLITFPTNDINFALMLDDGHIVFKPAIKVIIINTFVTISLIMLAAWFPARKAAKMPIGEALGHYE
jgi:putative ABC transport system permease protein